MHRPSRWFALRGLIKDHADAGVKLTSKNSFLETWEHQQLILSCLSTLSGREVNPADCDFYACASYNPKTERSMDWKASNFNNIHLVASFTERQRWRSILDRNAARNIRECETKTPAFAFLVNPKQSINVLFVMANWHVVFLTKLRLVIEIFNCPCSLGCSWSHKGWTASGYKEEMENANWRYHYGSSLVLLHKCITTPIVVDQQTTLSCRPCRYMHKCHRRMPVGENDFVPIGRLRMTTMTSHPWSFELNIIIQKSWWPTSHESCSDYEKEITFLRYQDYGNEGKYQVDTREHSANIDI